MSYSVLYALRVRTCGLRVCACVKVKLEVMRMYLYGIKDIKADCYVQFVDAVNDASICRSLASVLDQTVFGQYPDDYALYCVATLWEDCSDVPVDPVVPARLVGVCRQIGAEYAPSTAHQEVSENA